MTMINIVSSLIYTKGAPLREKVQTNLLAIIFLVILYNSPSGLVFYWILNNTFSLCKNIVLKMKKPKRIVYGFLSIVLVFASLYLLNFKSDKFSFIKCVFYFLVVIFIVAPLVLKSTKVRNIFGKLISLLDSISEKQNLTLLVISCISLCLLCGWLLPANVISTSPAEFSFLGKIDSPVFYIWSSFFYFAGLFVFWPLVIFKMFSNNKKVRIIMPPMFFVLAICALANVFLFKFDYGTISVFFMVDNISVFRNFSLFFLIMPVIFLFAIFILFFLVAKIKKQYLAIYLTLALCFVEFLFGFMKIYNIEKTFKDIYEKHQLANSLDKNSKITPQFHFSKTKPNVLVLFLDKAASAFFPYIIEQFPEMKNSYEGFVYYPNCLSFGNYTNSGPFAMMGGYEYTIDEVNKRSKELLKEKYNEAILVMPQIFSNAGYETTLHEVPYINYETLPIPHEFDFNTISYDSQNLINIYKDSMNMELSNSDEVCSSALKHFIIMQTLYPIFRKIFSNETDYFIKNKPRFSSSFVNAFAPLYFLDKNFDTTAEMPTFHFIGNLTTHEYTILREGYVPGTIDDEHPAADTGVYKWYYDGPGFNDFQGYHVNAAAHIQIEKFLNALKEKEVYNNTRIIIVADHGSDGIKLPPFEKFNIWQDAAHLNPLLLFKDFNSHGTLKTDSTIKTNADTVNLAIKDLPVSKINPFTGKEIQSAEDFNSFNVYILNSPALEPLKKLRQFPDNWKYGYTVHDNMFDESNWEKINNHEKK